MSNNKENIEDIFKFEPLIQYLLNDSEISDLDVRILTLLFRYGGYITLNVLTEKLNLPASKVSIKVSYLAEKGFIRKNGELMPIALVLMISITDLRKKLEEIITIQKNSIEFLHKTDGITEIQSLKTSMIKSLANLFPGEKILPEILFELYNNNRLQKNLLHEKLSNYDPFKEKLGKKINEILEKYYEFIQIIFLKHRKKDTYLRPKLPLKLLVDIRREFLSLLNQHYLELVKELEQYAYRPFESIITHQILQYPSEIKSRIETSLKHYNKVKIIYNGVYRKKTNNIDLIELISGSSNLKDTHNIQILLKKERKFTINQIFQKTYSKDLNKDFQKRDIILFENHGCLVVPSLARALPYYSISPYFIESVSKAFKSNWGNSN